MSTHTIHYSEVIDLGDGPEEGDVVDISYQCSYSCMVAEMNRETGTQEWHDDDKYVGRAGTFIGENVAYSYGGCPGGAETDYDIHCGGCGAHLWHGLQCHGEYADPDVIGHDDRYVCGSPQRADVD
jgi:hypothetical protein